MSRVTMYVMNLRSLNAGLPNQALVHKCTVCTLHQQANNTIAGKTNAHSGCGLLTENNIYKRLKVEKLYLFLDQTQKVLCVVIRERYGLPSGGETVIGHNLEPQTQPFRTSQGRT